MHSFFLDQTDHLFRSEAALVLFKKRISNIEQGMSNVEGRCSSNLFNFEKVRAKRFHTSIFYGSLFDILRFSFSGYLLECENA